MEVSYIYIYIEIKQFELIDHWMDRY